MSLEIRTLDLTQQAITGLPVLSPANDAFGRQRVSEPVGLFNAQHEYDKLSLIFEDIISGTASSTHLPNESSVRMDVDTASGDKIARRTYSYIRYQPGKSQLLFSTFVFNEAKANLTQRVGLFDTGDGAFLELADSALRFVIRTSTSGSAVNNVVEQADWNRDSLDGSGPSGVSLDPTKAQILWIDFEWLGVGQVRFGFVIDGVIIVCHEQGHANDISKVYMRTCNLPICFEIENTGITASASALKQICSSVSSEGGFEEDRSYEFSVNTGAITVAVASTPLIIIRQKQTFNGLASRGQITFDHLEVLAAATGIATWELYYIPHAGSVTGGAWVSVDANSIVEANITATSISGGLLVDSGFYTGTNQGKQSIQKGHAIKAPIVFNNDGTTFSAWALTARTLSGTLSTLGALTWKEIR